MTGHGWGHGSPPNRRQPGAQGRGQGDPATCAGSQALRAAGTWLAFAPGMDTYARPALARGSGSLGEFDGALRPRFAIHWMILAAGVQLAFLVGLGLTPLTGVGLLVGPGLLTGFFLALPPGRVRILELSAG